MLERNDSSTLHSISVQSPSAAVLYYQPGDVLIAWGSRRLSFIQSASYVEACQKPGLLSVLISLSVEARSPHSASPANHSPLTLDSQRYVYLFTIKAFKSRIDMEVSDVTEGHHAVPSPNGQLLACHVDGKLRVVYAQATERLLEFGLRIQSKDISALRWSPEGSLIAVLSAKHVEVIDLEDVDHRVRLDNGSGGLGRFVSAEFLEADQLLTIWEFGKARLWNLSTGKATDFGDLKTTSHGRNWQVRSGLSTGTAKVVALLLRSGAEDVLALHFIGQQKSMPETKLPTTDVQSLSWSLDGRWLALLDTATATKSVYIYTPDGHPFRKYPSAQTEHSGLGVKALTWSGDSQIAALSMYSGKIELLNARSFASMATIEHSTLVRQPSSRASCPIGTCSMTYSACSLD